MAAHDGDGGAVVWWCRKTAVEPPVVFQERRAFRGEILPVQRAMHDIVPQPDGQVRKSLHLRGTNQVPVLPGSLAAEEQVANPRIAIQLTEALVFRGHLKIPVWLNPFRILVRRRLYPGDIGARFRRSSSWITGKSLRLQGTRCLYSTYRTWAAWAAKRSKAWSAV